MNNTQIKKNAKYAVDYETDMNGNILDVNCVKLDARSKCPGNVQEYTVSTSIYPISVPVKCEVCGSVEERQFEVIIERNRGMVSYYISDPQTLDRRFCFGMEADKALSFEEVAREMVLDFIPVLLKEEAVMDAYHESLDDDDDCDDYDCSDDTHESMDDSVIYESEKKTTIFTEIFEVTTIYDDELEVHIEHRDDMITYYLYDVEEEYRMFCLSEPASQFYAGLKDERRPIEVIVDWVVDTFYYDLTREIAKKHNYYEM